MPYRVILSNISLEPAYQFGMPGMPMPPVQQPNFYVFNYTFVHDGPPGPPPPPNPGMPPQMVPPPPPPNVTFNNGMQQSFPLTVRVPHGPSLDQAQQQARDQIAAFLHELAGAAVQQ